jgi:DUF4097 and DUF4098 domain-containing protein YvlB
LDSLPLVSATKTVSEEFVTGNAPQVIVETFNGSIDVSSGKSGQVIVEVTKRASGVDQSAAHANLEAIEVSMIQKGNTIHVSAHQAASFGNLGASAVISVPPSAHVELRSSHGRIICEAIGGGVKAATSNGSLEVVDGTGPLDLATTNGRIEIAATDAAVDARTSNGRISFRGSLAKGDHQLKTSNGSIMIALPAKSEFRFNGSTSNDRIRCAFPIKTEGKKRRSRLAGTVGDNPEIEISASTSNGSIEVAKLPQDD